jgi:hypothetical protein
MSKFQRPLLTPKEKENLEESFINGAARSSYSKPEKEKTEALFLRISKSLSNDLEKVSKLTGYKNNMFCLQAIIEATRDKLKDIE